MANSSRTSRATGVLGSLATTPRHKAALVLAVLAVISVGLYFKSAIALQLRGGETVRVTLAENVNLIEGETRVKMAGLQVGVVAKVEERPDGTTSVELDVDADAVGKLGATPSARVQPLTILGGAYAVELVPGGGGEYDGSTIPQARTRTPVELDRVLAALPSPTRAALQRTTTRLGDTLHGGTAAELRGLTRASKEVMVPGGQLWVAARGDRPASDLPGLVADLRSLADALVDEEPHLDGALRRLDVTTAAVAAESDRVAATIEALPGALRATDAASGDLEVTLVKLDRAATDLMPTARDLPPLTREVAPLLREAVPLARQLPALLRAARPLVSNLVPVATRATDVVRHLDGPVIDRLNGPILTTLGSTYRGEGPFKDTGGGVQADNKFYEEIGYMVLNIDRASQEHDPQGSLLNFQAGVSVGTLAPLQLDEALAALVPEVLGR